jgi:dihydrofolate synthase/folylpolyglutamate synthase
VGPLRAGKGSDGTVFGRLASGDRFETRLGMTTLLEGVGEHQRQNAALAVAAAEALTAWGLPLAAAGAVEAGLRDAWLPARLELARVRPRVLVDAAHNVDSARALAEELRRWRNRPLWLVLGILRDKDAASILRVLLPLVDGVVVVTPTSPRALPAESLATACRKIGEAVVVSSSSVSAAVDLARHEAGRDGAVVVSGSFATASEARVALGLEGVVTAEERRAWIRAGGLERE